MWSRDSPEHAHPQYFKAFDMKRSSSVLISELSSKVSVLKGLDQSIATIDQKGRDLFDCHPFSFPCFHMCSLSSFPFMISSIVIQEFNCRRILNA